MSEQLRHKMNSFEATPPPVAWDAIAEQLADDKQYASLADKMQHYEAAPPPGSWKAIATRLEADHVYVDLATRMTNFEATPPLNTWNTIAATLEETTSRTPVVGRRSMIYRIAAAAVVIGALLGAWLVFNNSSINALVKNNTTVPAANPGNTTPNDTNAGNNGNPAQKAIVGIPPQPNNRPAGKTRYASAAAYAHYEDRDLKYAVITSIPAFRNPRIIINSTPIRDGDGLVIRDMDVLTTSNNYLIVTGPNGQSARISAKFASVIRYLNGTTDNSTEEYLDRVIKESDVWKKRFQEWRNKISQSAYIPSSSNFLDILELKELIEEK